MTKPEKLDLYKQHRADYLAPKTPQLVEVTPAQYLTITGRGEPGGEMFTTRLGALYNAAFTIKMGKKFAGLDYAVCKLEGLWWGEREGDDFLREPRDQWHWKLLIRTPEFINQRDLNRAVARGKSEHVADVKLEPLREGRCVQMLHVGPYATEGETIERMKEFIKEKGLSLGGLHHEVYLSDPRRVAPERLRTILRYPVR